jgi:hypothetical protein
MKHLLARALVLTTLTLGGVGLAAAPAQAYDCNWDASLGDTIVSGVGYVDIDVETLQLTSVCVNAGAVGLYVAYMAVDTPGNQSDSSVTVCVFTTGTLESCANPVSFVKVGIGNEDLANTGAAVSLGNVWVEVLNGSWPTIRIWVNDTNTDVEVPGRCVNVIGTSSCP